MSFFGRKSKSKSKGKEKEKENSSPAQYQSSPGGGNVAPKTTAASVQPNKSQSTESKAVQQKPAAPSGGATAAVPKTNGYSKQMSNDEVFKSDEVTLPPGLTQKAEKAERSGRKNSMSISKSGRHKLRGRQRSSVLEGDPFAGEAGASGRTSSSGATCRDVEPASRTQRHASLPTAV